ncbi:MAG: anhydro-N-acetylmuramic acid kinase [Magnetococcus sp. WYHC-3]
MASQTRWRALGLMSGTSADGIDAALIDSDGQGAPHVLGAACTPYPGELRARVLALYTSGADELERLGELDHDLGEAFAQAALDLCSTLGVDPGTVDVIGSHGQTVRHRPPRFTCQIAQPAVIAARTGITTVADFRPADMAQGGEGAPLVPLFHQALYARRGTSLAVVNLGGIANITALPATGELVAGDTGPANALMDCLVARHGPPGATCDTNGQMAAAGQVHRSALAAALAHPYFSRPFPKSTGRELFGTEFLDSWLGGLPPLSLEDALATLAALTVESVARTCESLLPPAPEHLLLCGGGACNGHLVRQLRRRLPTTAVTIASHSDSLEAQAFAWLAIRTLRGLPGAAPGATGARRGAILGGIWPGGNWSSLRYRAPD